MPRKLPHIHLVLGGARSGKTRHALALVEESELPRLYLATAEPRDVEMRERIAKHRAERGSRWRTREEPLEIVPIIEEAAYEGHLILIDCLTLWLSNLLMHKRDIEKETAALVAALERTRASTVLISNEVGQGIVPDNPLAREFRDHAGLLHQAIAAAAERVTWICAGIPTIIKGGS